MNVKYLKFFYKIVYVYYINILFIIKILKFTEDCGNSYGCYKYPTDCLNRNCQYIVKWQNNADNTIFDLFALINGSDVFDSYVAIGFSKTYESVRTIVYIFMSVLFF
jgi:hypothetical protein